MLYGSIWSEWQTYVVIILLYQLFWCEQQGTDWVLTRSHITFWICFIFFPYHPSPFTFVHDLIHLYHSLSIFIQGQFAKLRLHLVCCHRFSPGAREPFGFPGSLTGLMCHDLRPQRQIKLWSIAHLLVFFKWVLGMCFGQRAKGSKRETDRQKNTSTTMTYCIILQFQTFRRVWHWRHVKASWLCWSLGGKDLCFRSLAVQQWLR